MDDPHGDGRRHRASQARDAGHVQQLPQPRIARRHGTHADAWNSFGPPETFAHKNSVLDNWCAEIGRDPAEIERTVAISPDDVDQLGAFLEAGATHIIVMTGHPFDLGAVETLIARRDA